MTVETSLGDLELSEHLLGMSEEEIRALEQWVAKRMAERLEALLFSAPPGSGFMLFSYEPQDQPFVFYRPKS